MVLMGIELILNSANINFIAFARYGNFGFDGQLIALFVIILAAAEAAVASVSYTHLTLPTIYSV